MMSKTEIFLRARPNAKPQCGHLRLLYATSSLSIYQGRMNASPAHRPLLPRGTALAVLFVLGAGLGGCADMSDTMTLAFADPAKYDLYECKQLETERTSLAVREAELQGLMAKADTGVAGPVVAELAYRNDYIALRGQAKLAEEAWRRNKCRSSVVPVADAPALKPVPSAHAKGGRAPVSSGSVVY
jgi:hypothetical protein